MNMNPSAFPLGRLLLSVVVLAPLAGCDRQPAEPDRPPPRSLVAETVTWEREPKVLIPFARIDEAVAQWDSRWQHVQSSDFTTPGLLETYGGRTRVLRLHGVGPEPIEPCRLRARVVVPEMNPELKVGAAAHAEPPGRMSLRVLVDGEQIGKAEITHPQDGPLWHDLVFSLSDYAGKEVEIVLEGMPLEWAWGCLNLSNADIL